MNLSRLSSGGVEIVFEDAGAGDAILFVHGHPFDHTMWRPQVQSLRWKYRTLAPDLRGYGKSALGPESANTLEIMAGDLVRLLDHLKIGKVCVVGLSMGGQIAMEFATAHPDRTAAAVFAATFPQAETPESAAARNRMADRIVAEGVAIPGAEMLPKLIGRDSVRRMPWIASGVYQMMCSTNPAGAAAAIRGRAKRRDYREPLTRLRCPVMIVYGTDDGYTTRADAESMHAAVAGSRLEVFEHAGHMPNLEDEDRFNRVMHEFLATVSW